jgi:hypothetical protein
MDDTRKQRHGLISAIETERKSKVLAYMLSPRGASVADDVVPPLFHQMITIGHVEKLDLFISARGGSPESVWRVLSLLREYTDHLSVIVPGQLFSASAFLALGADEIVMTPLSELGPMHIQTMKGDLEEKHFINPFEIIEYMRFASEWDVDTTTAFDKIEEDPQIIGKAIRAYRLAEHVCTKALGLSSRKYSKTDCESIVGEFINGSHSSNLPFTPADCRRMGLPVTRVSQNLDRTIASLQSLYMKTISTPMPTDASEGTAKRVITPAILETTRLTLVHKRRLEHGPEGSIRETPGWGGWMDDTIQEAM